MCRVLFVIIFKLIHIHSFIQFVILHVHIFWSIHISVLQNRYIATIFAVVPAMILTMWSIPDPVSGSMKQTAWILWPIFGASNQMLAALTLMILTLYFWQRGKPILFLFFPMLFIMVITFTSLLFKAQAFYAQGNILLLVINLIMIILIIWMVTEGIILLHQKLTTSK